jgi:hypothetical protein
MPQAAPRACRCGALVAAGQRCPRCTRAYDQRRGNARERGYDEAWQEIRLRKLRQDPTCQCDDCLQLPAQMRPAANVVDHRDGNSRNNSPDNLRSMLKAHHDRRTMRDQGPNRNLRR